MKKLISLALVLTTLLSVFVAISSADDNTGNTPVDSTTEAVVPDESTTEGEDSTEDTEEPDEPVECAPAGDTTGDGKVNLGDVSLLLKHIAKWSGLTIDLELADAVNDDKVNLVDVSAMLKHIAKWNTVRLGHNDSASVVKAPTCKETGETVLTCKVCGSVSGVTTSVIKCIYTSKVTVEPTCAKDGTERFTCTMCGEWYDKTLKATGKHNYVKTTVSSVTCGKDGIDRYTCSVCKDSYDKTIKATGKHNYVKSTVTAATCAKDGVDKYTCSVCKDSYTMTVKATGKHNYVKKTVTAPTCGAEGVDKYTCSVCKDSYTKTVAATGKHHYFANVCYDCGKNNSEHEVYTVGETWVVNGQWEFTITSVKKHSFCNKYVPSDDSLFGGEEVFIVEYTYKNLGYNMKGTTGLYVGTTCFSIHDGEDELAHSYPCTHERYPTYVMKGETGKASEAFVIKHEGPAVIARVSLFRSDTMKMEYADFVVKIS